MPCPDPNSAGAIFINSICVAIDQALLCGVGKDRLLLQPKQPLIQCADPGVPLPIFIEVPGHYRHDPMGADELKDSIQPRTDVQCPRLAVGAGNGQSRGAAGLDHLALAIRRDAGLFSVDGLNPEGSALVDSRAPDCVL